MAINFISIIIVMYCTQKVVNCWTVIANVVVKLEGLQ